MLREAYRAHPMETGGLLVGYRGPNETAVVTRIVGPGPNATHCAGSFEPDYDYQEAALKRTYLESAGVERYLGDWHTHPDGRAKLSSKDVAVLQRIAGHAEAGTSNPLMVVIAMDGTCSVAAWRYERRRWSLPAEPCELVLEQGPDTYLRRTRQ